MIAEQQQQRQQQVGSSNPLYKKIEPRDLNVGQSKTDVANMLMRRGKQQLQQTHNINKSYNNQNKKPVAMKLFDPFAMIPQQKKVIKGMKTC